MRVLSLFDGMACTRIALDRLGIVPEVYFASEIDKHAIKVAMANYPDIVQLGDVTKVKGIDLGHIDLLVGGSPCQGFSFAGKGLNFSDPRSRLFFEYVRILKELRAINPEIKFLLENVRMVKRSEYVITEALGVEPVFINSTLVSAQERKRNYWTNIRTGGIDLLGIAQAGIPQPEDRGILLKDILQPEDEVDEKYYLSEAQLAKLNVGGWLERVMEDGAGAINMHGELQERSEKSQCVDANYAKGMDNHGQRTVIVQYPRGKNNGGTHESKSPTVTGNAWQQNHHVAARIVGRNPENPTSRKSGLPTEQHIEPRRDSKTGTITTAQKDNVVIQLNESTESGGNQPYQQNRVYSTDGETPSVLAGMSSKTHAILTPNLRIRRLTEIEVERLQTVPDNHTNHVSSTQRYRMLGNGFTVDVIAHILSYMNN